jgi:PAS domain S-box-containing protein
MSLRARLCLLVALAAVPLIAVQLYGEWQSAWQRLERAGEDALRAARLEAADQRSDVEGVHQFLAALTRVPAVRDLEAVGCNQLVADMAQRFQQFDLISVTNETGAVVCSSRPTSRLVSFGDRPHIKHAMATGEFAVGVLLTGRVTEQPTLPFAYPVRDEDGRIRGVAVVSIAARSFVAKLREKPLPPTASLVVTDRDGVIVGCVPGAEHCIGRRVPTELEPMLRADQPGTIEAVGEDAARRLYGFVPVGTDQHALFVAVGIPKTVILAEARDALLKNIAVILFGVVGAALVAWFGGRALIALPVARLLATARRWRAGDLAARSGVRGRSELGQLGAAFDAMADAVAERERAQRAAKDEAERAADALRDSEAELMRVNERLERRVEERTRALADSEGRYRMIAENALDLITRTTAQNIRIYASPGAQRVLGYAPEELIGAPSLALVHPDDLPIVREAAAALREGCAQQSVLQYRARHKDGHWLWVEVTQGVVVDSANPDRNDIISVIRDVSERRRLEEELRASQVRSAAFFEHTTAGLIMVAVEPDGRFVYEAFNPAHCRSTGFDPATAPGETPHDLFPPAVADRIVARYRRCVESGEPLAYVDTFPFPSGDRSEEVALVPIRDERGRVARILISVHDITEQQKAEAQLRQAQKMEAVGQLTGGIAHDFNNLLTAVIGNLEMAIGRAGDDARLAPILKGALNAAERGAALTQRLLAFARKQHLSPKPVEVGALVAGIEDLLQRTLGPAIRLVVTPEPGLWPALIDPNQLEVAILNLSINARDAMLDGGALRIAIENRRAGASDRLTPGDYVVVAVSDTGSGIDETTLARVFEPFFTTKEVGKGSGLGLPMVQGFAVQSGGDVRIRSKLGEGTTVELWLPRAGARPIDKAVESGTVKSAPGAGRILLCDDDADVRRFASEFLTGCGYAVHEANGPSAALRVLDGGAHIDCLVVDFAMPEMSGTTLAEEARRRRPGLKVLMITGHTEPAVYEIGGLAILRKPFKPAALAARLAEVLSGDVPPGNVVTLAERRA